MDTAARFTFATFLQRALSPPRLETVLETKLSSSCIRRWCVCVFVRVCICARDTAVPATTVNEVHGVDSWNGDCVFIPPTFPVHLDDWEHTYEYLETHTKYIIAAVLHSPNKESLDWMFEGTEEGE